MLKIYIKTYTIACMQVLDYKMGRMNMTNYLAVAGIVFSPWSWSLKLYFL